MWVAGVEQYFNRWDHACVSNATEMYNILSGSYNWDIYAICAVLANTWRESTFNPWLWEGRSDRSTTDYQYFTGGYGLIQWTPWPPTPFPNVQPYIDSPDAQLYIGYDPHFSDRAGNPSDGQAQTNFIVTDMFAAGNYFPASINYYRSPLLAVGVDIMQFRTMTKADFASGAGTPYTPTAYIGAFALNYLRPDANEVARRFSEMLDEFDHWYQYFTGQPPPPQPPSVSIYMMNHILKRKKGGFIIGL